MFDQIVHQLIERNGKNYLEVIFELLLVLEY